MESSNPHPPSHPITSHDPLSVPSQRTEGNGAGGAEHGGEARGGSPWPARSWGILVVASGGRWPGAASCLPSICRCPGKATSRTPESNALSRSACSWSERNTLLVPRNVREACWASSCKRRGTHRYGEGSHADARARSSCPVRHALDPSRLYRIKVRFAPCEAYEIAKVPDISPKERDKLSPSMLNNLPKRELRTGDFVKKGERLATVFSVDVGQKKNDLIDAASQLALDEQILEKGEKAVGALPDVALLNYRRNVEADHNNIARALNTTRSLEHFQEGHRHTCFTEADEIIKRRGHREHNEATWPNGPVSISRRWKMASLSSGICRSTKSSTTTRSTCSRSPRSTACPSSPM